MDMTPNAADTPMVGTQRPPHLDPPMPLRRSGIRSTPPTMPVPDPTVIADTTNVGRGWDRVRDAASPLYWTAQFLAVVLFGRSRRHPPLADIRWSQRHH